MFSGRVQRARQVPRRRGAHRAIALVAGVALLAPVVVSVLVAPASAAQGDIYTVAGNGSSDPTRPNGDGTPATTATVTANVTVFDAQGNLILMDDFGDRVRIIARSPANPGYALGGCVSTCTWTVGDIYTIVGTGTYGYSGDGGPALAAQLRTLNLTSDLTTDPQGDLLIVDQGSYRVRVVAETASNPGYVLYGCGGPCTWVPGDIYSIAGSGGFGDAGDGGPASGAAFNGFVNAAVDSADNVLLSDENNSRVRIVAVSASNPGYVLAGCTGPCVWTPGDIYTIAGSGTYGYSGDGGPATSARLMLPRGLAIDAEGNPLIADASNYRVRLLAVSASNPGYVLAGCTGPCVWTPGDIYTIAGDGNFQYSGDGGPAAGTTVAAIFLTMDHSGNVLATDGTRLRIVAVSATNPGYFLAGCDGGCTWTVGNVYTVAGNGDYHLTGDGGLAINAGIPQEGPAGIDANGNLYVPGADKIREIVFIDTPPSEPIAPVAVPADASAKVSWDAPDSSGGLPITGYEVTPYVGATAQGPRLFSSVTTTQVITGLANAQTYTFTVAAVNALGVGAASATAAIKIGTPFAPTGVLVVSNSTAKKVGSATVRFTGRSDNGGCAARAWRRESRCTADRARSRSSSAGW
jgi:trimeric autotransporter adhesin